MEVVPSAREAQQVVWRGELPGRVGCSVLLGRMASAREVVCLRQGGRV